MMERYTRELPDASILEGDAEETFWSRVSDFTSAYLASQPYGAIVRLSATQAALEPALGSLDAPILTRAGNGISYLCFETLPEALSFLSDAASRGLHAIIEAGPADRANHTLWPNPGSDFAIMERVKRLLDPGNLLNPGRLFNRI
jgi:FAD/FMN-containing dehydrogenase